MRMANKRNRTKADNERTDKHRARLLRQVRRRIRERAAEAARRTGLQS
jgi:hypothetical protein